MRENFRIGLLFIALVTTVCGQVKDPPPPAPNAEKRVLVPKGLMIRYIANQGVFLESGEKRVLIDAIHQKYKPAYLFPPPDLLQKLESAASPYNRIDLLLVTHTHLDHFHAGSAGLHLQNDPRSVLVSSAQVRDEMVRGADGYDAIKDRIREVTPALGKRTDLEVNGLKLSLLGLKHVNPQFSGIQNMGYLVTIGGKKVLHVGDAELTAENFAPFQLEKENIDIAILPQWFLEGSEGCTMVKKLIGAKNLIATHISAGYTDEAAARIKQNCAGADAFTKILEERNY